MKNKVFLITLVVLFSCSNNDNNPLQEKPLEEKLKEYTTRKIKILKQQKNNTNEEILGFWKLDSSICVNDVNRETKANLNGFVFHKNKNLYSFDCDSTGEKIRKLCEFRIKEDSLFIFSDERNMLMTNIYKLTNNKKLKITTVLPPGMSQLPSTSRYYTRIK